MLLKNSFRLVLTSVLFVVSGCFGGTEKTEIGGTGFYFVNLGGYQRFLVNREEEIVILPTIVDFIKQKNRYVFIRQVVQEYTCTRSLMVKITGNFEYWILYKKNNYMLEGPLSEVELQSRLTLPNERWEKFLSDLTVLKKKKALLPSGNDCDEQLR